MRFEICIDVGINQRVLPGIGRYGGRIETLRFENLYFFSLYVCRDNHPDHSQPETPDFQNTLPKMGY